MGKKTSDKRKLNLYQKEQLILCILVLCFVASIFSLPKLKVHPPNSQVAGETSPNKEENKTEQPDMVEHEVVEETPENVSEKVPEMQPEKDSEQVPEKPSEKNTTEESTINSQEKPNEVPPEDTTLPEETEKIWVPPVYKVVHHEAVYETVRVMICNYCSEEFKTVGEFQVHKDAHGG